jgi:hypothetical protein
MSARDHASPLADLDVESLSRPIGGGERAEAKRRLMADAPEFAPPWPIKTITVVLLLGGGGVLSSVVGSTIGVRGRPVDPLTSQLAFVAGIVILVLGAAWVLISRRAAWTRHLRLAVFSQRNGFEFRARDETVYPGVLFHQGGDRRLENVLRRRRDRVFEAGEFVYETGNQKYRREHRTSYLLLQLDRRLPHILLDARSNNGLFGSNLPIGFDRSQILHLEGDFDRYFTLYCPKGYERDALYLFTPDVMAAFIDNAAHVDVEIVDDLMFVYDTGGLPLDRPADWVRIQHLVAALWPKTEKQTSAYSDDRLVTRDPAPAGATVTAGGYPTRDAAGLAAAPDSASLRRRPDGVAEQGQRLRARMPIVYLALSALVTAGVVCIWVFRPFA